MNSIPIPLKIITAFIAMTMALETDLIYCQDQEIYLHETMDTSYRIMWVGQYPDDDGEPLKRNFKDRLELVITGSSGASKLSKPVTLCVLNDGSWWVLDQATQSIVRVEKQVGDIPHFKNSKDLFFPSLVGICKFSDNRMLISDSFLNKIFVLSPDKKEIKDLNDSLKLDQPTGIAYNPHNKEVWVVETRSHRISILDENGQFIRHFGQRGTAPGEFNFPTSIWIDDSGTIFIVDAMNFRIQIFSSDGEFISVFGEIGDATGYFARPKGIATDTFGHIYIADALYHVVQVFNVKGQYLYSFGNQGREKGEFWMPGGIYIDNDNNIYVADTYNSRIQVFKLILGGSQ